MTHRCLHWGPLFRIAHYSHHESRIPGPWSSTSFHPIEGVIFFSAYMLSMMMPTPRFIWIIFKAAMVLGPFMHIAGMILASSKGRLITIFTTGIRMAILAAFHLVFGIKLQEANSQRMGHVSKKAFSQNVFSNLSLLSIYVSAWAISTSEW